MVLDALLSEVERAVGDRGALRRFSRRSLDARSCLAASIVGGDERPSPALVLAGQPAGCGAPVGTISETNTGTAYADPERE